MGKERARLDDFILLAEGTEALLFSSSLFMLSFQAAPELFINPKVLAEKNLPTSKSGKGEPETQRWLGNHSLAHRKSAQMRFLSVSHPPVFFQSGENKLARERKRGARKGRGGHTGGVDWRVLLRANSWVPRFVSPAREPC